MSTIFAERPNFFEGQYLGAADLEAFLKYARENDARHLLGAHTWGIVAGIDLVEGSSPAGEVEYFLTPGVAVDGYGRLIVVATPFRLTTDLFARQPSGIVDIWIRYDETHFSGQRAGFQHCDCSDNFSRVAESVVVEVGPRAAIAQRESGVLVGDEIFVDAREALGDSLPNKPLACDGSVAAQTFPDAETRSLWLIPVGKVPWDRANSSLQASTEADKKASLIFRRVAGLVTGHIYPADGVIRLRPRWSKRWAGDEICTGNAIQEADLVTCESGELSFREMIWLEGHSRFTGDVRLYGSRLEFREAHGTDYLDGGVPLAMRRQQRLEKNGLKSGFDLEVLLGKRSEGPTRLTIGRATVSGDDPCNLDFQFEPGVYIQEDAKLGIGTQDSLLSLPLTIRADDTGSLIGFENGNALAWQINFGAGKNGLNFTDTDSKETRLFLHTDGNVGIGTDQPRRSLHVHGSVIHSSGKGGFSFGDQGLNDFVDEPTKGERWIWYSAEGIARLWSGSAKLSVTAQGNLGVGTTAPTERLDVRGDIKLGSMGNFFGVGCLDNLRMIAGRVSSSGNIEFGSGFSVTHTTGDDRYYVIKYDNVFFSLPIVVATLVDSANRDNFLTIVKLTTSHFELHSKDDVSDMDASYQDSAFNFIALGYRL